MTLPARGEGERRCWGLTSGSAGMIAQVRALAATLGLAPVMKEVRLRRPFVYLPNRLAAALRSLSVPHLLDPAGDALEPPWPEMVISCGRRAAAVAMGLKAKAPQAYCIHIQDPQVNPAHFDLVVAMAHDRVSGPNVLKTRFALHAVTPGALDEARRRFAGQFAGYPRPLAAALLGGSTNKYTLSRAAMERVIAALRLFLDRSGASLLITPSRRTGEENIRMLRETLGSDPRVYLYDFSGENPYLGMLALADAIIVTDDSVNMMSEAYATGKPICIVNLPGHRDTKPSRFAERLIQDGIARPLAGTLERWDYPVVDEMGWLAGEIGVRFSNWAGKPACSRSRSWMSGSHS